MTAARAGTRAATRWNVAGATMSVWHENRLMTGYYWDALTAACLLAPESPRTVLLLGLGWGTTVRQLFHFLPELHVTAVEIDPRVIKETRRRFVTRGNQLEVIEADAYQWLARCQRRFDAVLDDIYAPGGHHGVHRPRLIDESMIRLFCFRSSPGGLVAVNLMSGEYDRKQLIVARAAFRDTFPEWRSVRPLLGGNSVLVGGPSLLGRSALRSARERLSAADRRRWDALRLGR